MVTQSLLHIILILWLSKLELAVAASLARTGCPDKCGDIDIPYPFGIGAGCYMEEEFAITCNQSFSHPKPIITSINLELLEVSLEGTVRVNSPIISSNCANRPNVQDVYLYGMSFFYSDTKNRFTAIGCNNIALMKRQDTIIGGCMSICNISTRETGCYGINCCQTTIPRFLKFINASFGSIDSRFAPEGCKTAFMVDQEWFTSNGTDIYAVQDMDYVPVVLDWGKFNGTCQRNGSGVGSFCGSNAYCSWSYDFAKLCFCKKGYTGNPFLPQGCQDIDECSDPLLNRCEMICINTPGSYNCSCSVGYVSYGKYNCFKLAEIYGKKARVKVVVIGTGTSFGALLLLLGMWWLYKIVKRRKKLVLKEKFFKRNGGLLLQQQLSSGEGNVDKTKLFTSKELEKATDHYNENRILGQGGQGTVYKGMLIDGRIVAIKKSKMVDEGKLEQFINEVVILSQIIHRNVVKLLGCCLETEVPLLVYEYIPNGTLSQYIHDQNEEFPVSWEMHLRIAVEVASALYYLHSAASIPIYHRDIKSSNILLDDKYRAKVSDFGTSRTIAVDQTHLTTLVHGTFGYLDPEYFQSSQFTEKSDVYSFGVVLVELLTGQKPISSTRCEEGRNLATYFLVSMKENRLFDIIDARIVRDGGKEQIMAVANLAKRCLNLNGKKRPTMKEVAMELDGIKNSNGGFIMQRNYEQVECAVTELNGHLDAASTSTRPPLDDSTASSLDIEPLLLHTL